MAVRLMPLEPERIEAATRLYLYHMPQWRQTDAALFTLGRAMPGFGFEASLVKVAAANALYSTSLRAIHRMALHISTLAERLTPGCDPTDTVNAIAALPALPGETVRRHRSFASKFAAFFVDPEGVPIYDSAVCDALRLHLPPDRRRGVETSYGAFIEALEALCAEYGLSEGYRGLDRYLWLAGMARKHARGDREINRELRGLFECTEPPAELAIVTDGICPSRSAS